MSSVQERRNVIKVAATLWQMEVVREGGWRGGGVRLGEVIWRRTCTGPATVDCAGRGD